VASIRHLSVSHGHRTAVDDATFSLSTGEIVALTGPNGAGKSSLLQAMALPRTRGTVMVHGVDVAGLSRGRRRSTVALVPEAFDDLLFATTVAQECRRADRHADASMASTADTFALLLGHDSAADLPELIARHPRDLSAGERLCLVMAIQLSAGPSVLLVDEPTRGLDEVARALVGSALVRTAASGATVMVATHDHGFATRFASRTISMKAGRVDALVRRSAEVAS
jgi:energy-coupling factor transport system ATP-binding protein